MIQNDKARYSYDAFNRTTKVETFDGNIQLNRYDAEGLRYEMEENGNLVQFIFNQEREVVTEEDSTGITRLIRARELIARSTDTVRTYYHYASDEMGSTTHIVDEAGAVQNWYEYDAWGNITAKQEAIPNRYTYYGQQLDPITQQYYLRARFYNPVIGRFTQEDAYRGDGLNLYAYCANNPVYYVDPSGYDKLTPEDFAKRFRLEYPRNISFDPENIAAPSGLLDIAKDIYEKIYKGEITTPDGQRFNSKNRRRKLTVYANLKEGEVFFGFSGTKGNQSRLEDSLPKELEDIANPELNSKLKNAIDEAIGKNELPKHVPGGCGEFSAGAHILALNGDLNEYVSLTITGKMDIKGERMEFCEVVPPCLYCRNSILDHDVVDQMINKKSDHQDPESNRFYNNPREGCPNKS